MSTIFLELVDNKHKLYVALILYLAMVKTILTLLKLKYKIFKIYVAYSLNVEENHYHLGVTMQRLISSILALMCMLIEKTPVSLLRKAVVLSTSVCMKATWSSSLSMGNTTKLR